MNSTTKITAANQMASLEALDEQLGVAAGNPFDCGYFVPFFV